MFTEELAKTGDGLAKLVSGTLTTLNSAGGGATLDTAKLEATVAELSDTVDKMRNQKIQIEFTGDGKAWFKGQAADAAARAVMGSNGSP